MSPADDGLQRGFKSCLVASGFTTALFLLPLLALAIGWIGWDFRTGGLAALATFITLASGGAGSMILIRNPSALVASLPLMIGMGYAILPDFIPGTIDDGLAFGFGALLSFLLWRKRRRNLPAWTLIPLLACSVYTTIGGFILPFLGPLDEMIVYLVVAVLSWIYYENQRAALPVAKPQMVNRPPVEQRGADLPPAHPGGAQIYDVPQPVLPAENEPLAPGLARSHKPIASEDETA